ncbi:hypothetical protein Leryth_022173 [Lithospermum erythrorhizon]|nr:hypothetical protein Leryth_022173 [Lithospermum erythrorhizon]
MGLSLSKRHHHRHHHHHDENHPQNHQQLDQPPPPQTTTNSSQPPPPPPPLPPPPPPSYSFAANSPYPTTQTLPPPAAPPPPPPRPLPYYDYNTYNNNYQRPVVTHPTYHPYFLPPPNVFSPFRPPPQLPPPPPLPAVPYVDHQSAKKIKNDVNVRKESIKLVVDESNHDSHLVCFTFDAMVNGSITVMYFGKEGDNCSFTSVYPEIMPVKIPFQTGIGQKFCQPSGNGIDLGFFDIDDLSKPWHGDVFPLVILAESAEPSTSLGMQTDGQIVKAPSHAQITLAILEKNKESQFQVKVIKQILWVDGVRYELREIYGISNSAEEAITNQDKECVICMTDPKNTTVLPCRHMCLCSACAKELRLQSNKCPICRQPIQELLEIKIDED